MPEALSDTTVPATTAGCQIPTTREKKSGGQSIGHRKLASVSMRQAAQNLVNGAFSSSSNPEMFISHDVMRLNAMSK
jgi:hypothetical protein